MNALVPTTSLLCKLGSIARHVEELYGPQGSSVDAAAAQALLEDPEVVEWMEEMDAVGLLPVMR